MLSTISHAMEWSCKQPGLNIVVWVYAGNKSMMQKHMDCLFYRSLRQAQQGKHNTAWGGELVYLNCQCIMFVMLAMHEYYYHMVH